MKFSKDEFTLSKKGMSQFFIFELTVEIIIIVFAVQVVYDDYFVHKPFSALYFNLQNLILTKTDNFERVIFVLYICYFPFIQAYGLVFFKDSKDPLSHISKLDYLKIISINQKETKSFKELSK